MLLQALSTLVHISATQPLVCSVKPWKLLVMRCDALLPASSYFESPEGPSTAEESAASPPHVAPRMSSTAQAAKDAETSVDRTTAAAPSEPEADSLTPGLPTIIAAPATADDNGQVSCHQFPGAGDDTQQRHSHRGGPIQQVLKHSGVDAVFDIISCWQRHCQVCWHAALWLAGG